MSINHWLIRICFPGIFYHIFKGLFWFPVKDVLNFWNICITWFNISNSFINKFIVNFDLILFYLPPPLAIIIVHFLLSSLCWSHVPRLEIPLFAFSSVAFLPFTKSFCWTPVSCFLVSESIVFRHGWRLSLLPK